MQSLRIAALCLRVSLSAVQRYLSERGLQLLTRSSAEPGRERYRRAGLAASTAYIARGLSILVGFVSVPLTVSYLGAERYGVWLTISSLLLWVALTDFGFSGIGLVNVLSEAVGQDDQEAARHYSASAFWALVAIAFVIEAAFLATFYFIPWQAVFHVSDATSTHELQLACALVLSLFVFTLPLSVSQSLYNAHQDGYLANIWGIASGAASLLALIIVTRFHGGLPNLVIAMSGVPAIVLVANACYVFVYCYPWLAPSPSAVRWSCIRRLLKLGGKYMIMRLASLGIYQSQPMIITQILGPSKVVIFVIAYKVVTLPVELAYMGTAPFVSAFGEAKARRDWNWITGAYKNGTLASVAVGLPMAAVLALIAKPLILIWAGPLAVPDSYVIFWLFVYTTVGVCLMMAGHILCGVERLEPLAISLVLCAVSCVVLGLLLAPWWGVAGVAFAMAISKVVTFWPIQIYAVRRIFRERNSLILS